MAVPTELNYIDGEWVDGGSDRWITVTDPSHDVAIARVPDSTAAVVDSAVRAARQAFDEGTWRHLPAEERRAVIVRLAVELEQRMSLFDEIIPKEAGCPVRLSGMMQTATPIGMIREMAEWAGLIDDVRATPITSAPSVGQSEVRREPVGVCAGFVPFNFPLFMTIWKSVPPILMGNSVVIKSSPLTPLASIEFIRACESAGVPHGVINLVHGDVVAGEALVEHPDVDHVTFTGSTAVGSRVMASAAPTVKRLTLELGGKSPSILLPGGDVELAARAALFAAFMHAGQACVATTRFLVPDTSYADALELLRERTEALVLGPAEDYATDVGPLISDQQLDRVDGMVQRAVEQGAKVVVGGRRAEVDADGFYYLPTVLADIRPEMEIAREEVFGPVLAVLRYSTVEEAVALANGTDYGLGAAVWGPMVQAREVARLVQAGTVWINDYGVLAPQPFGGYKRSGFGREYGLEGMLEYTQIKHIYTSLDGGDLDSRPYGLVGSGWPDAEEIGR
ncbi:aldehyde dehydrogenase [Mycolicibacterium pulveris]|uniref:aldehyde dehydrogenase (NAD(+)) n=1 Tax=Mycolicibacterium pulveris TaxID=36813 RepID=A0A7I7UQI2_MYCPV|nr:aldehyde dehydrogenase family protein [Mycolicibacterium pulveris]MCV6983838.1 aldehyde dehydrogenase [Mycolicibacterium pulveris]BBY83722.1 aldehyde dehydrogenase [Mycolicibacterium pulveris]